MKKDFRRGKMELLREFWEFMREKKKFWLLPMVIILLLFGALIVFTETSAVAPFIYTLF
jgi:drug/metabolite transporter superfamily protein YnfA